MLCCFAISPICFLFLEASEAVNLDILSYEDLKVLREQKLGTKSKKGKEKSDKLQTKRYLIMTYTVEFDQIHYPLPLTYTGKRGVIRGFYVFKVFIIGYIHWIHGILVYVNSLIYYRNHNPLSER